jgi:hypothetical protein
MQQSLALLSNARIERPLVDELEDCGPQPALQPSRKESLLARGVRVRIVGITSAFRPAVSPRLRETCEEK